jgi:hypothetical protein
MNNIFLRFYLLIFAGIFQLVSSQTTVNDLSDGTLRINGKESLPVKILPRKTAMIFTARLLPIFPTN